MKYIIELEFLKSGKKKIWLGPGVWELGETPSPEIEYCTSRTEAEDLRNWAIAHYNPRNARIVEIEDI